MRRLTKLCLAVAAAALSAPLAAEPARLERRGEATQLIVDGKPFLVLGGELSNSAASNRSALAATWERLRAMHLNTVLAPVSWELIEPEEGRFDFGTVDWLIADARAHGMHLVLLWFGTWKNSMSTYAPGWVKRDTRRFPRAVDAAGKRQDIISALSRDARQADARAFAALMSHVAEVDRAAGTVVMVQVENEMGLLSLASEGPSSGDAAAGERAQAGLYARYANAVAQAGKRAHPLPMYVNGAQNRPGKTPGDYPSGGPLAHLAREWRDGTPAIDFIAPDIYFPNFAEITDRYAAVTRPLFIPEADDADRLRVGANALRAIGKHNAMGFSPFSIDTAGDAARARIGSLYAMLGQIAPLVLDAQAAGRIAGVSNPVSFAGEVDLAPIAVRLGGYTLTATTIDPWTPRVDQDPATHGALVVWLGGDDFLFAGQGVTFTVADARDQEQVGLERVEEGTYSEGGWIAGRRLNGDQTHQGRHIRLPPGEYVLQKVQLYRY